MIYLGEISAWIPLKCEHLFDNRIRQPLAEDPFARDDFRCSVKSSATRQQVGIGEGHPCRLIGTVYFVVRSRWNR